MASTHMKVSRRAADRLRGGHLWVYRSDLLYANASDEAGALVTVDDPSGKPLGTALYSSTSQIALRLVSRTPDLTGEQYLTDLRNRVAHAIALRRTIAPLSAEPGQQTNAQRLIFSEADNLPGI